MAKNSQGDSLRCLNFVKLPVIQPLRGQKMLLLKKRLKFEKFPIVKQK